MVECKYCEEEFDNEEELHLHWGDEHEDELNSHDKEKVKKAHRQKEDEKEAKLRRRKQVAGWGLAGVLALAFVAFVGSQMMSMIGTPGAGLDLEDRPALGDENASVEVVAFEDFRCPHCKNFEDQVLPQLKENYIDTGEARLYFVHFPILGPDSETVAQASECVYRQDEQQFWSYKDALFAEQATLQANADYLVSLAEDSTEGLDYTELRQCIESGETQGQVNSDTNMGRQNGVSGTPTVFVNGDVVSNWNYNGLSNAIDAELQE